MLIFRATSLKYCYLHVLNFYLDNGVMTTPKRRILSFVFTVLSENFGGLFNKKDVLAAV